MAGNSDRKRTWFTRFAKTTARAAGHPATFCAALAIIVIWAVSGPLFRFSNTWQLVINTGTTIITFLMVFVIQQSQNKDTMAVQLKLNELIASSNTASNRLIDVEDITSEDLETLKKFYIKLSQLAEKEMDIHATHSIDEASDKHKKKMKL